MKCDLIMHLLLLYVFFKDTYVRTHDLRSENALNFREPEDVVVVEEERGVISNSVIEDQHDEEGGGRQKSTVLKMMKKKKKKGDGFVRGTSRYRGVSWSKRARRWRVFASVDGTRRFVGSFVDEVKAARAYDSYLQQRGVLNRLFNFPNKNDHDGGDAEDAFRQQKKRSTNSRTKADSRKQMWLANQRLRGASQYRGVHAQKSGKWKVQVSGSQGTGTYNGTFPEEIAAARAYDAYVIKKKLARFLNFPDAPAAKKHKEPFQLSRFYGVKKTKHRNGTKFAVRMVHQGQAHDLGTFSDEEEAARTHDAFVIKRNNNFMLIVCLK